jgi:hypothetical protein
MNNFPRKSIGCMQGNYSSHRVTWDLNKFAELSTKKSTKANWRGYGELHDGRNMEAASYD